MNLIQQFLEENLSRDLNHQILQQIQNQNSAIETLVCHLQDLRERENADNIEQKIHRIENFLELKKQIGLSFQSLSTKEAPMFNWILNNLVDNSFLYELVKREEFFIQKQLTQMGKKIFFQNNNLQQLHEDIEFGNKLIRQLKILSNDKSQIGKALNRQKVKEIDFNVQLFQDKITALQKKVADFNTQMLIFLRKIYSFEEKIKNQFYLAFNTSQNLHISSNITSQDQLIPPQIVQDQQEFPTENNSKSHLSVNSKEKQSRLNFNKTKQFTKNQQTPRKYLQVENFISTQNLKPQKSKLVLKKRSSAAQDRYSNYSKNIQNYQNQGSVLDNKRMSADYNGRSSKNSHISYHDEMHNMNKTLSAFNYYKPESSNIMYTTTEFGQQVRLPSKWTSNSRSSITYYPTR